MLRRRLNNQSSCSARSVTRRLRWIARIEFSLCSKSELSNRSKRNDNTIKTKRKSRLTFQPLKKRDITSTKTIKNTCSGF